MLDCLIDTHCHLHDQEWFTPEQAEDFLQDATRQNVQQVIVIGTDPEDSANAHTFATAHPNVDWTYGVHPEWADKYLDIDIANIARQLRSLSAQADEPTMKSHATAPNSAPVTHLRPVAIGEIGLDYHYEGYDRAHQIQLFEKMLQLAQDLDLPVSLHIREAFADAWPVLDNFPKVTGVVHSFTGSKKDLRQALARGFYIGVNGLATYTTPALPPLEKMLLETDAPFLTPVPFRGTINKPGYVSVIAAYLAEKMGAAEVKIVEQTTQNARQLFKLRDTIFCPSQGL